MSDIQYTIISRRGPFQRVVIEVLKMCPVNGKMILPNSEATTVPLYFFSLSMLCVKCNAKKATSSLSGFLSLFFGFVCSGFLCLFSFFKNSRAFLKSWTFQIHKHFFSNQSTFYKICNFFFKYVNFFSNAWSFSNPWYLFNLYEPFPKSTNVFKFVIDELFSNVMKFFNILIFL